MSDTKLSRAYLETLPSADLIALADDLGIDIPENLNRRFIIGELLEAAEDMDDSDDDLVESSEVTTADLPETYNETVISAVLRNPVWLFVYWDVKKDHITQIRKSDKVQSLSLRVNLFHRDDSTLVADFFDVPISLDDRNRYVLLPAGFGAVRVDLVINLENDGYEVWSSTGLITLPYVSQRIANPLPEAPISPVLKLSGLPELLRTHYMNHRQSFF